MIVIQPNHTQSDLKKYVRACVAPSPGAEMICSALSPDINVQCLVALDERGIAGAVSYTPYKDRLHVFSLGSIVKGAGSLLMDQIEAKAVLARLPVTVAATRTSESFYQQRGYRRKRGVKITSIIPMVLKGDV